MKKIQSIGLGIFCLTMLMSQPVVAQVEVGLDFTSRYVWRGADFGNSPSLQPEISFTTGNLTLGGWAAFATNGNPAGSEINFFASYAIETSAGDFELSITDYNFPEDPTGNFFSADAHFVELGVGYSGTESLPISLFTGVFVTNDDDYSLYAEVGYSLGNLDLSMGFTPAASALYETNKAGIVSVGVGTSRDVKVTDTFGFTLSSQFILNPYQENAFFLVGISF